MIDDECGGPGLSPELPRGPLRRIVEDSAAGLPWARFIIHHTGTSEVSIVSRERLALFAITIDGGALDGSFWRSELQYRGY